MNPHRFPLLTDNAVEPSPQWKEFREQEGILLIELPTGDTAYLLTRWEDVHEALVNPVFSRAALAAKQSTSLVSIEGSGANIVDLDPPEHTRLRQEVSKAFTARNTEKLRPRVQELTDSILDEMLSKPQPVDFLAHFAEPVTLAVTCELLGVPYADRARFVEWTLRILAMGPEEDTSTAQAREEFYNYVRELADAKRQSPANDLLSAMVAAHDADAARLSEAELLNMAASVIVAGLSTANAMGRGLPWLLRSPRLYAELGTATEHQLSAIIEELLRIVTPTETAVPRLTTQDVTLSGTLIPAGSLVIAGLVSGNHDESVFPDAATLAPHRDNHRHLALGGGPHFCLGAALARLQMKVGLATLSRRVPTLRLAVPESSLRRRTENFSQSLKEVPVAW